MLGSAAASGWSAALLHRSVGGARRTRAGPERRRWASLPETPSVSARHQVEQSACSAAVRWPQQRQRIDAHAAENGACMAETAKAELGVVSAHPRSANAAEGQLVLKHVHH